MSIIARPKLLLRNKAYMGTSCLPFLTERKVWTFWCHSPLKYFLLVTELGLLIVDENKTLVLSSFPFSSEQRVKSFLDASSGTLGDEEITWTKSIVGKDDQLYCGPQLVAPLSNSGLKPENTQEEDLREISRKRVDLLVSSGLAPSVEIAEEAIRNVSLELSNLRIREMSAKPDLQAMESVLALDEIDKTANIVSSRVREWYGLHFPELVTMIDDNTQLIKLVLNFKTRSSYDENELEQMGYSKNKSKAIAVAAKESRGADIRDEDLARILQLAEEAQHLFSIRDKLASHVEKTMREVAPNVSEIAGASIGARLIAKAGGLEKLSILPASTIQILGAEKALYRALKSGSRPPKHGILFQHAAVHSAPKWQRGRIARAVAGKIAIAARIDQYRGTRDAGVEKSLMARLDEIKVKYKEPPKERPQFVPQRRSREEFEIPRRGREDIRQPPGERRGEERRRAGRGGKGKKDKRFQRKESGR
jgi:nucleolar protein 56